MSSSVTDCTGTEEIEFASTGMRDPVTITSSNSSCAVTTGDAVATATVNAASANAGLFDNDLIILASFKFWSHQPFF